MPRPKLKSDEEVLAAATVVLKRGGPLSFTLTEVASEVGLSRAALIQRFTSRDELLRRLMVHTVTQVQVHLDTMPVGTRPEELWRFLRALIQSMNTRYDFSVNFLISWYELQIPELRDLARQRNRAVRDAISRRLPADAPQGAARLLHAAIAGATAQWAAEPQGELAAHVLEPLATALRLMFPAHAATFVASKPEAS